MSSIEIDGKARVQKSDTEFDYECVESSKIKHYFNDPLKNILIRHDVIGKGYFEVKGSNDTFKPEKKDWGDADNYFRICDDYETVQEYMKMESRIVSREIAFSNHVRFQQHNNGDIIFCKRKGFGFYWALRQPICWNEKSEKGTVTHSIRQVDDKYYYDIEIEQAFWNDSSIVYVDPDFNISTNTNWIAGVHSNTAYFDQKLILDADFATNGTNIQAFDFESIGSKDNDFSDGDLNGQRGWTTALNVPGSVNIGGGYGRTGKGIGVITTSGAGSVCAITIFNSVAAGYLEVDLNPVSTTGSGFLIYIMEGAGLKGYLSINAAGLLQYVSDGTKTFNPSQTIDLNTFYNFKFVWNGAGDGTISLYLNGTLLYNITGAPNTDIKYATFDNVTGVHLYSHSNATVMHVDNFKAFGSMNPYYDDAVADWTSAEQTMTGLDLKNTIITHSNLSATSYIDKIEWLVNDVVKATYDTDITSGTSTAITNDNLTSGTFRDVDDDFKVKVYMRSTDGADTPEITQIEGEYRTGLVVEDVNFTNINMTV